MSSPIDAENSCSRLSPHIAFWINLDKTNLPETLQIFFQSQIISLILNSFRKRLYWHCHFIQKLETEPELEFNSMHSMCDELRPNFDSEIVERWIQGKTGFSIFRCMHFIFKGIWMDKL